MKAILYNRILLFLGVVGLFIAGVLSLAHFWHVVPPCGVTSECDRVTSDSSSMWFGGRLYVGYVGLGGYILLTAFALVRSLADPKLFRSLSLLGYLVAVGGTIISIGLQFYSFFVIHAMCKWCLSSAVTMTVSLVVYALMYQEVSDLSDEALGNLGKRSPFDFFFPSALAFVLATGLVGMRYVLLHSDHLAGKVIDVPKNYPLVPPNANVYGDPSAPVTIVEFADLNCPSCQINSPKLKEFVHQHDGKLRLVYRHFPIPSHHTSQVASAIDEYAADKGKFWDYTMAVMGTHREIEDSDELFQIAQSINLDVNDIKKRLGNVNDPIYKRLSDDQNCANLIGVSSTPTFIIMAPGSPASAYGPGEIFDALKKPPYSAILDAK